MSQQPAPPPPVFPALLRHARRTYGEAMRTALADEGYDDIPANGLYIIGGLALGAGGVPIGALVKDLGISKQRAGQLVDALVMRGYVERTPDQDDRRQLIITLTERGRAAAATQAAARQAIDAALLAMVGDAALEQTRQTLVALIEIGRQGNEGAKRMSETTMTFDDRSLKGALFRNCAMAATRFEDVGLADARFVNVNLQRARFVDVNLAGVSIDDANIEGMTVLGYDVRALIQHFEAAARG